MEVVRSIVFPAGIRLVQVGDALAHCQWGLIHCVSSDRVRGGSRAEVSGATDEQVADTDFLWHFTEGAGDSDPLAELCPASEVSGFGSSVFSGSGLAGASKSSAEVSEETISGGRVCSTQGLSCGWDWLKWERKRESVRCCRREAPSAMMLASPGRQAP